MKKFLKLVGIAALGGAIDCAAQSVSADQNAKGIDIGRAAYVSALVGAAAALKSPLTSEKKNWR